MAETTRLLALRGSPFLARPADIWIPEVPHALRPDVHQRLLDGTYDQPFLVDLERERLLCFALDGSVQTAMDLRDPFALVSDYTRKMMGFLLLQPRPRDILMLGLGGGALPKYCHRHLPDTRVTVIEVDAGVIALRDRFNIPPDDDRLRVVLGDGADFVASRREKAEVLLVDAFDRRGLAPSVTTRRFFADARACLATDGVFVMNLAASRSVRRLCIARIREAFGEPVIVVSMPWEQTTVVFAFERPPRPEQWAAFERESLGTRRSLGLSFPRLQRRLRSFVRRRDGASPSVDTRRTGMAN